jgi:hypothetical protein
VKDRGLAVDSLAGSADHTTVEDDRPHLEEKTYRRDDREKSPEVEEGMGTVALEEEGTEKTQGVEEDKGMADLEGGSFVGDRWGPFN